MEPEILRLGKAFHAKVQEDWQKTAEGNINKEHHIELSLPSRNAQRRKTGRLDIYVDDIGDLVSVVEIKSTDWDKIKPKNIKKLLGSHRRQIWNYIDVYLDEKRIGVSPGMIYPTSPRTNGLKELIETYLNEWGIQVVWYYDP